MTANPNSPSIDGLIETEKVNPATRDVDLLDTEGVLLKINDEDAKVAQAVRASVSQIAPVVDKVVESLSNDGHLFYVGAGTSGRLGVLDASECPPTFGTPPDWVQGIIAGGEPALRNAIEGAEDNEAQGQTDFLKAGFQTGDVVVGISASGHAPYVHGALKAAKENGCFTVALVCHDKAALIESAEHAIVVSVGPEVVTGSTRMKAGTAQKLVLNMLTTGAMIRLGKTYENLMVDVQPTNSKLVDRAERIVSHLAGVDKDAARQTLTETSYQVKPAVVMLVKGVSKQVADETLSRVGGKLRLALED